MITREEFLSAKLGDWFVDSDGQIWDVVGRRDKEVYTVLPGTGAIGLSWDDKKFQILDDDWCCVNTLNNVSARFIRNTESLCLRKQALNSGRK